MENRELVLIRHGETVGGSSVRLYGASDIGLSEVGREQMRRAGAALNGAKFDAVLCSPLSRSAEGARLAANGTGPAPVAIEEFREINFGRWEGWTFEEAATRDPANYAIYKKGGLDFRFPGGEVRMGFRERISKAARRVFADPPGRTLAVLHKGVIKVILATLAGIPIEEAMQAPLELGAIYRLRDSHGGWRIVSSNETGHLGDARVPQSR